MLRHGRMHVVSKGFFEHVEDRRQTIGMREDTMTVRGQKIEIRAAS